VPVVLPLVDAVLASKCFSSTPPSRPPALPLTPSATDVLVLVRLALVSSLTVGVGVLVAALVDAALVDPALVRPVVLLLLPVVAPLLVAPLLGSYLNRSSVPGLLAEAKSDVVLLVVLSC
jgi:hypothetical protein